MRCWSASSAATVDDEPDADLLATQALGKALAQLTAEIGAACAAASQLNVALADAAVQTARVAPDSAHHVDALVQAAGQVGPAVAGSVGTVTAAIDGAGSALADELDKAAKRLGGSFGDTETRLAGLTAAIKNGEGELTRLSGALGKVSANADATAGLLDSLGALTASIDSFMARRQAP